MLKTRKKGRKYQKQQYKTHKVFKYPQMYYELFFQLQKNLITKNILYVFSTALQLQCE